VQVRMTEAIVELARSGQGIAVLSGWAFNDLDNKQGLTPVRIGRGGFKRTWRAVVGRNANDEHVTSFIACVQKVGATMRLQSWRKKLQERSQAAPRGKQNRKRRAG
jgi:DNA-binding transcriptional LysR family regulator